MSVLKTISGKARSLIRSSKKNPFVWRYVSNLRPTISYAAGADKSLTATEEKLLGQLNKNGIAVTSIVDLVEAAQLSRFYQSTRELPAAETAKISRLKLTAAKEAAIGRKTFNLELLGNTPHFDIQSPFAKMALTDSFLNIANAYFRMLARLRYYNVWYTAASNARSRESQLWHFDREDYLILKVFFYLDDVDEGAGPFTYAPGTHKKGRCRSIEPRYFLEGGVRRSTDAQMSAVFAEDRWIRATGKKGTIIFADTRGYHKGGEARTRDRLMFICMYTSPASESRALIEFPKNMRSDSLTKKQLASFATNQS